MKKTDEPSDEEADGSSDERADSGEGGSDRCADRKAGSSSNRPHHGCLDVLPQLFEEVGETPIICLRKTDNCGINVGKSRWLGFDVPLGENSSGPEFDRVARLEIVL